MLTRGFTPRILPFNLGGASSLATTPATGTPENQETDAEGAGSNTAKADAAVGGNAEGKAADGDAETVHEQINLVEGGPGEENEEVVRDVRVKVMKFESAEKGAEGEREGREPVVDQKGVGPLRVLKHKTTGAVRMLLRREPTGQVALNRAVLPSVGYKAEEKYVKLMTSDETGSGLETWMVQVKTKELAQGLAEVLEKHKEANK